MMRIKDYTERALNEKDVTLDVAMTEIRYTVDAYDEYFHTGRNPVTKNQRKEQDA